jgi:hypothetical protein
MTGTYSDCESAATAIELSVKLLGAVQYRVKSFASARKRKIGGI